MAQPKAPDRRSSKKSDFTLEKTPTLLVCRQPAGYRLTIKTTKWSSTMKAVPNKTCARHLCHAGLILLAATSIGVQATENGGSSYPMGSENYMSGAMPPPGLYSQFFVNHYEADSLRDNSGAKVPVDFRVRANAIAPRLIWVTEQQVFGGSLAFHAIAPLVDLKVELNGQSQSKQGLGDMIFGPALGFHHSEKLHSIVALDLSRPPASTIKMTWPTSVVTTG
jgi:hypothetical protein